MNTPTQKQTTPSTQPTTSTNTPVDTTFEEMCSAGLTVAAIITVVVCPPLAMGAFAAWKLLGGKF